MGRISKFQLAKKITPQKEIPKDIIEKLSESGGTKRTDKRCPDCSKLFKYHFQLVLHAKYVHNSSTPYLCYCCERRFATHMIRRGHLLTRHATTAGFLCPCCNKTFKGEYCLRKHMVTCVNKKYICKLCPARFTSLVYLQTHSRLHSNALFECSDCDSKFVAKSHLKLHRKVHLIGGPLKCPICNAGYSSKYFHSVHVRDAHKSGKKRPENLSEKKPSKYLETTDSLSVKIIYNGEIV